MEDFKLIVSKVMELLTTIEISVFGYRFSLISITVGFVILSITIDFVVKIFGGDK